MDAPMIYQLRSPKNFQKGKRYPALFVMHGIGSNERNMQSLVDGLEEEFFIFSIRGHLSNPAGYAYFTIQGYGNPYRNAFDEAIQKLTSFIEYASKQYPLELNRLYLLGFSQGAILSMTLGLTLGDKIRGIVALSGYIPQFVKEEYNIQPGGQTGAFISHGEFDQVLPYEWGAENATYFRQLGIPVTFKTYQEGHTVSTENVQDYHIWLRNDLKK